jgi:murein L,D-transpeptidase YafK
MFLMALIQAGHADTVYEQQVVTTLENIQQENLDSSLKALNDIVRQYPNSKLGHLVLADLLSMRAGSRNLIEQYSTDESQLRGLRDEIRYRWDSISADSPALSGMIPSNLLQSPEHQFTLVADASRARLYVYQFLNNSYQLVDNFYMTVGRKGMGKLVEGDLKTPVGVYFVTSYINGNTLPPRYGPGAFPIDYPNELDLFNKRTGYGIWIHGTEPENYNRVPLASDGCLSLSNDAFVNVQKYIKTDGTTPIIISREIEWVDPDRQIQNRSEFTVLLRQWVTDWESLDSNRFLDHYSGSDYMQSMADYESWVERKQKTIESKKYINVAFENISFYRYPGEQEIMLISFDQRYNSDSYQSISRKKQYWKKDHQGNWKIVYEKAV